MVDLRVTLYDGKAHSVDSSDMAFQKAGRAAIRDAVDKAKGVLLEPVDEMSVLVADDVVGAIMSDLSSRRGRVIGTEPVGTGRTLVRAEVPELEILRYAAMPAPATPPRFIPTLNPCAPEAPRSARIARLVWAASSAVSGPVRST